MLHCWLCVHLGWGDHPSSPPATCALAATSSEEEGLHARPLPHTYGEYCCVDAAYDFCVVAVFIGGGRIGTLPSSSQWRGVLRSRDRPSFSHFRCVHRRGRGRPSSSQCRYVRRLHVGCAVQVVRGQDRAGLLTVGTLRRYHPSGLGYVLLTDAGRNCSRHHAADVWSSRACWSWVAGGRDAIGDTFHLGRSGAVALLARSGGTMVCGMSYVLHTGAGLCHTGRSSIPCDGCAGYSWAVRAGLPAVWTPSAIPSV